MLFINKAYIFRYSIDIGEGYSTIYGYSIGFTYTIFVNRFVINTDCSAVKRLWYKDNCQLYLQFLQNCSYLILNYIIEDWRFIISFI